MTGSQAIAAGLMAVTRRDVRAQVGYRGASRLVLKTERGDVTIYVDHHTTRAILDEIDRNLSNRLEKLGVSEQ